jgi:signal transduction histidine kinase
LLAALAAGLVLMAVIAAQLLGRRLAAPLVRLAGAARRLGEGDFAARAPRAGVTEVDAVAQALDATAERLDALVSRERAFSADASHQLRTPLAALRIELEASQLRGNPPTEIPAALAQVDRLQSTIDTLLAAARDAPDRAATADLSAALRDLEQRWHGRLAAAGRPLRTRVLATPALARLSPGVVDEILDVLVENAERHGAGAVTVTLREAGGSPVIDVADEGGGFAGDPEAAFTRRGGSSDGHGIGLALARSLAEAEGGRLVVSNASAGPVLTLLLAPAARGSSA